MSDTTQTSLWDAGSYVMPHSASFVIRSISALCAFIGTILILPLFFFLTIDISLWLWRHFSTRSESHGRDLAVREAVAKPPPDSSISSSTSIMTPTPRTSRR
ncbi:hypothetical protein C2857_002838 [Epichloe festucae Fl1]|uniref:Uncharacterized protein n=1 Tax=Epichloe festucae (strain Fl1) TaxID=877507 RepID=A0A7U3Q0G0_EPIFF|nr:hypothetical protein C2857_002838 [Epichloe festucae Fl1]